MNWLKQVIAVFSFVLFFGQAYSTESYVSVVFNSYEITHGDDSTWPMAWAGDFQVYGLVKAAPGKHYHSNARKKKTRKTNAVFINKKKNLSGIYTTHRFHADEEECFLSIQLFDYDEASDDDNIDIAPANNSISLTLYVDFETGIISEKDRGGNKQRVGRLGVPMSYEGFNKNDFDEITAKVTFTIKAEGFDVQNKAASATPTPAPAPSTAPGTNDSFLKTGYYKCNDGGHYYVKVQRYNVGGGTKTKVFWFGEHSSGSWANVFEGTVRGNRLYGKSYDVAKGTAKGNTDLILKINDENSFEKLSGAFGGTSWNRSKISTKLPGVRAAGFSDKDRIRSLNGAWECSDGGLYYIRQIGNEVVWFGEGGIDKNGYAAFANVAFGTRSGNNVYLDWIDVPKGNTNGNGRLRLQVDSANRISKISGDGFGGQTWRR